MKMKKYDLEKFEKNVEYYKIKLKKRTNNIVVLIDINNDKAYYSIAPLSKAASELNKEIYFFIEEEPYENFIELQKIYFNKNNPILKKFLSEIKVSKFKDLLNIPKTIIVCSENNFKIEGKILEFKNDWVKKRKWNKLIETSKNIWNNVYGIKKKEIVKIKIPVIPKDNFDDIPIEDYLDSYFICKAMIESINNKIIGFAYNQKKSMLDYPNKVAELQLTLLGLELSKKINKPIFREYNKISEELNLNNKFIEDILFYIKTTGYHGKHLFGETIGYPTTDLKKKWKNPNNILYQLVYSPESFNDDREPRSRLNFTQTLPIEDFILTCNIDWKKLRKINDKLYRKMKRSDCIVIESKINDVIKTKFKVNLIKKNGEKRRIVKAEGNSKKKVTEIMNNKKLGDIGNLPDGEVFLTPESVEGTIIGDVTINIDQSYELKKPMIVKVTKKGYEIIKGNKEILNAFNKKLKDSWKLINILERNKTITKKEANLKRKNFKNIGEFAINTNPKAKLTRYLIVNEKIAKMIHIAFGLGFEADKETTYHMDMVINAKKQKLDIYGFNETKNEKIWLMKKGDLI